MEERTYFKSRFRIFFTIHLIGYSHFCSCSTIPNEKKNKINERLQTLSRKFDYFASLLYISSVHVRKLFHSFRVMRMLNTGIKIFCAKTFSSKFCCFMQHPSEFTFAYTLLQGLRE